jgi:hypothetical protein
MSVFKYLRERGVDPLHVIPIVTGRRPDPTYDGRARNVEIWTGVPR